LRTRKKAIDHKIREIARRVGFRSQAQFSPAAFQKAVYGVSATRNGVKTG